MNKNWTPDQIEGLRKKGSAEAFRLHLIEAAALLYLDRRDRLLCNISAMDGEWPEDSGVDESLNRQLRSLREIMNDEASTSVEEGQEELCIGGVLDRICVAHGYNAIVWSPAR